MAEKVGWLMKGLLCIYSIVLSFYWLKLVISYHSDHAGYKTGCLIVMRWKQKPQRTKT